LGGAFELERFFPHDRLMSYCKAATTIARYFEASPLRHQPTPQPPIAAQTPKRPVGSP